MAWEKPVLMITVAAGEDLSSDQYKFVTLSSGAAVKPTQITDVCIGVLQNAPASGEMAEIMMLGISKVNSNEALAVGDIIGTETDAQAQVAIATNKVYGVVLKASTAAGGYATAAINCFTQAIKA